MRSTPTSSFSPYFTLLYPLSVHSLKPNIVKTTFDTQILFGIAFGSSINSIVTRVNPLTSVKQGDYVYINSKPDTHGLMVVGWDIAVSCTTAIQSSTQTLSSQYTSAMRASLDIYVPYVTDFTLDGQNPSLSLQSSIPKPFYCTRFDEAKLLNGRRRLGNDHSWWFFTLPEKIEIESVSKLFVDTGWTWTAGTR